MHRTRAPKKSESIEIRIPYDAKLAFMDRCRREGQTASEALRAYIDLQIAPTPRPTLVKGRHLLLGAVIAAAAGAAALPSLAGPGPADPAGELLRRAAFSNLDRNHDGVISLAEYRR